MTDRMQILGVDMTPADHVVAIWHGQIDSDDESVSFLSMLYRDAAGTYHQVGRFKCLDADCDCPGGGKSWHSYILKSDSEQPLVAAMDESCASMPTVKRHDVNGSAQAASDLILSLPGFSVTFSDDGEAAPEPTQPAALA